MDKQTFFDTFAQLAIEQQQKYGIPASVTLAQLALESGWGSGRAVKEANNAFCVKGTYNGQYILISDNAPNEKFRKYDTIEQSFEDHSRLLMKDRYRQAPGTDYKTWTAGIQKGGYAYPPSGYADKLNKIIEQNNLTKYDAMGLSPTKRVDYKVTKPWGYGQFSFPLQAVDGQLVMTSDIGHRNTGIKGASDNHNGLDLRAKNVPVLATETGGKVLKAESNGNSKSGKHIIVEYERDGHKFTVSYCHLSCVDVKVGDTVKAGQQIGVSGNSSYRDYNGENPLDPHLHLTIRKDGVIYDPKKYLAEIAAYGDIGTALVAKNGNGTDLLAEYKPDVVPSMQEVAQPQHTSGFEIAMLSSQSLVWGNAQGQAVSVGDICVYRMDDYIREQMGAGTSVSSPEQIDKMIGELPEEKQTAARAFYDKMKSYLADSGSKYVMVADINGQQQLHEISKEDYDKFVSADSASRMFLFDKNFDEVAMIPATGQGVNSPQNPYASLVAMVKGEGAQDFMSWFLNKNGDGAGIGSSGDILGDMVGTVIGGLMSLKTLFGVDEETQVANLREMISARMSPEDQAKVEQLKREGVDPERAKMLVQTNAEAGLTASESQQQQQQITMRG